MAFIREHNSNLRGRECHINHQVEMSDECQTVKYITKRVIRGDSILGVGVIRSDSILGVGVSRGDSMLGFGLNIFWVRKSSFVLVTLNPALRFMLHNVNSCVVC